MALDLSYGRSPFPFYDRPTLPHIDAFQDHEKFKILKELTTSSTTLIQPNLDPNLRYGYFTVKEIKHVFKFIKTSGDDESFGFTLDELETAFRRVKRAIKNRDEEYHARRLMNTFEFLLKIKQTSPKQWFKTVDTSQANKGDGKLTWLEFEAGMNKLCEDLGAALFTKHDLITMLKYLDPNGDGDLSYHEVTKGFARIHRVADCKAVMINSGPIIPYLQDFMRERQIRVRDLFNFLDIKNKKSVPLDVFCEGVARVGAFLSPNTLNSDSKEEISNSQSLPRYDLETENRPASESRSRCKKDQELITRSRIHLPPVKNRSIHSTQSLEETLNTLSQSSERGYQRHVRKQFREYDDWLKQFDRKLQNGLILMSKM